MIRIFLVLGVLGLSACDLPQSYAQAPKAPKADKAEQPPASGVRVSGYARVGVSHHF